jgi:hypothetical protein
MQTSTTLMIAEIAKSDPVMAKMLEQMGLISIGADGTVTVNFGDSQSQTDDLIASIDALTLALGGIPPSVTTDLYVNDYASDTITGVKNALFLLDGSSATTYVKTVHSGQLTGAMHGGVIGYADGGVVARMGETGPELFTTPRGNWGIAATDSYYNVPAGTSVLPAPATRDIIDKARGGGNSGATYYGPVQQTIVYDESSFVQRRAAIRSGRR